MRSLLIAIALAALAGTVEAREPPVQPGPLSADVTFVNESPARVLHVYIWRRGNSPWLEDALGSQYIEPGRQIRIRVVEGVWCIYDYEVEFADDRRVSGSVDLCRDPVVRLTPEAGT
jgi:hypothetical protein